MESDPRPTPLVSSLLGARDAETLEARVFRGIALVSAAGGALALLVNLVNGNPPREVYLAACAIAAGLGMYFAGRRHRTAISVALLVAFGALLTTVWFTNDGSRGSTPYWFTVLAVSAVALLPGRTRGLGLCAVLGLAAALLTAERLRPDLLIPYLSESHRFFDVSAVFVVALILLSALTFFVFGEHDAERSRAVRLRREAEADRARLEQALAEIEELRGLLPICCSCKRIRDETGDWQEVESFISGKTSAQFTHSFCPACADLMMDGH